MTNNDIWKTRYYVNIQIEINEMGTETIDSDIMEDELSNLLEHESPYDTKVKAMEIRKVTYKI